MGKSAETHLFYEMCIRDRDSTIPAVAVDGVYGQETARAVRAVQRSLGYSATGAVGPVLWSYIITQGQGYGVF